MLDESQLIEKLRRIEALFAGAATEGERNAADAAAERIRRRLAEAARVDPPVELRFSVPDPWSRRLLLALLRRYGIEPYRYPGQRRTTVLARLSRRFVDETLMPEFQQINATLQSYLQQVTERVIAAAVWAEQGDEEERTGPPPELGPGR